MSQNSLLGPARGRGPFPGPTSPGHSAHLPIRLELRIPDGPLQPDGTTLVDFVITNVGTETIAVPSSVNQNDGPSSDVLTLWFTSDGLKDEYFQDTTSGRLVKVEIVPTSAELYGRRNDPQTFILVAPKQSVKVHASSRVQWQPGTHKATAHAELVRGSSILSELVDTADSETVTMSLSTVDPTAITGKVFRSDSNETISNSYILLTREQNSGSDAHHFEVRTNENGEYIFRAIPAGNYTVSVYAWFLNKADVPCEYPLEEKTADGGGR
jgi:hypothetical protein